MKYPVRKLFRTYINVSVINYIHFENYIQVILFSALRFPRQVYFLSLYSISPVLSTFFLFSVFSGFNRTYFPFFKFLLTLAPSVNLSVDTLAVSGDSFFVEAISIFFVFAHTYFYFSVSAHAYPFRRLSPPPSPTSGDGLRFVSYSFVATSIQFHL